MTQALQSREGPGSVSVPSLQEEREHSPGDDWNGQLVHHIHLAIEQLRTALGVVTDLNTANHLLYFAWHLQEQIPPGGTPPVLRASESAEQIVSANHTALAEQRARIARDAHTLV
eukprot:443696-Rhodomonas_salina.1